MDSLVAEARPAVMNGQSGSNTGNTPYMVTLGILGAHEFSTVFLQEHISNSREPGPPKREP
jgi:hypothetical protein